MTKLIEKPLAAGVGQDRIDVLANELWLCPRISFAGGSTPMVVEVENFLPGCEILLEARLAFFERCHTDNPPCVPSWEGGRLLCPRAAPWARFSRACGTAGRCGGRGRPARRLDATLDARASIHGLAALDRATRRWVASLSHRLQTGATGRSRAARPRRPIPNPQSSIPSDYGPEAHAPRPGSAGGPAAAGVGAFAATFLEHQDRVALGTNHLVTRRDVMTVP
jgi:hypothetical protein